MDVAWMNLANQKVKKASLQNTTERVSLFIWNVPSRQIHGDRREMSDYIRLWRTAGGRAWGWGTSQGYSSQEDENVQLRRWLHTPKYTQSCCCCRGEFYDTSLDVSAAVLLYVPSLCIPSMWGSKAFLWLPHVPSHASFLRPTVKA